MPEHLIRYLHAAYAAPADGVTDADLLGRVVGRDDAAFELLVRRHAGQVWRVCRAVARDHHAAEDAFQATFLTLARNPAAVRARGSVAGWLYRVAYHAALKARPRAAADPSFAPTAAGRDPAAAAAGAELARLVHAELARLPDRYREPVVLCHLHGYTQTEAAKQLGLPPGTVATRVRRGLDRLRVTLARRGVAAPAAGLAGLLGPPDAAAAPSGLVAVVVKATAVVPSHILDLSEGALSAMKPTPWKLPAGLAAAAACVAAVMALAGPPDSPKPATPPVAAATGKKRPAPSTYAQRARSRKNLQRIAQAVHDYWIDHNHLPTDITDKAGKPLLSWRVAVLPYLDQDYLYAQFKLDEPWDGGHNKTLLPHMPRVFRTPVPGGERGSETYVQGFTGPGAAFQAGHKLDVADFPDGTSNTILAVEAGPPVPWTRPADKPYHPKQPLPAMDGPYSDRIVFVFVDGSVHDLAWNLPERTYRTLIERADGMVIPGDIGAPPAGPLTEEDRKEVKQLRLWVANRAGYLAQLENDRRTTLAELEQTGGIPDRIGPGPNAGVEEWQAVLKRLERQESLLREELDRLRAELDRRKKAK